MELWSESNTLGIGSWSETICKKQELHVGYFDMAFAKPSSPISGEPKVMQSGHLVVVRSSVSSSDKVKREATDPPKEFPVMINWFELSICIKICETQTLI